LFLQGFMYFLHVHRLGIADQLQHGLFWQGPGLGIENHLFAEQHQGGDGTDLKMPRQFLFLFRVDLGKHDVRVLLG